MSLPVPVSVSVSEWTVELGPFLQCGYSRGAPELMALFCMRCPAWLPPLTILWTCSAYDVIALTPKIVKDGTPDQRALLQTRFPRVASLRIDRPGVQARLNWTPRTMRKLARSAECAVLHTLKRRKGEKVKKGGGNRAIPIPSSSAPSPLCSFSRSGWAEI